MRGSREPPASYGWRGFSSPRRYALACLCLCGSLVASNGLAFADTLTYNASLGGGWDYSLEGAAGDTDCGTVSLATDGLLSVRRRACAPPHGAASRCLSVRILSSKTTALPRAAHRAQRTLTELVVCPGGSFASAYRVSETVRISVDTAVDLPFVSSCLAPSGLNVDVLSYVPLEARTSSCKVAPPSALEPAESGGFVNVEPACFGGSEAGSSSRPQRTFAFALVCGRREFEIDIRVTAVTTPDESPPSGGSEKEPQPQPRPRRATYNPTAPNFVEKSYAASIVEEIPIGSEVTRVRAVDPDSGLAGVIRYSLEATVNQRSLTMFRIDSAGVISVRGRIDREDMAVHNLVVRATDSDLAFSKSDTALLTIKVLDVNDNTPAFEYPFYDEETQEIEPVEAVIARVRATDADSGENGAVRYAIVNAAGVNADFAIDPELGEIKVARSLDRERTATYSLTVEAVDQAADVAKRRSSTVAVTVRVLDVNDNYPVFSQSDYTFRVLENLDTSKEPTVIGLIRATDKDEGLNGLVRYSITVGNPAPPLFRIGSDNGQFMVLRSLDREQASEYTLRVRARDMANETTPKSNVTTVKVLVIDVNDNRPVFKYPSFSFSVYENVPVRTVVGTVPATDADVGDNARLVYSIMAAPTGMPISVDSSNGVLVTNGAIDRETAATYTFIVVATDNGTPPLNATASVTVTVMDMNDNAPSFSKAVYSAVISEDAQVSSEVATIVALDPDENDVITYSIVAGDSNREFVMSREQSFGVIRVAKSLNYQRLRSYELIVVATDTVRQTATCRVLVNVTGKNRFAPTFSNTTYSFGVSESLPIGTSVYRVTANDQDIEDNGRVTYHFVPSSVKIPFKIDPDSGIIYVNSTLDRDDPATQSFELDLIAEDRGTPKLSSDPVAVHIRLLDVNDNPPVFERSSYATEVLEDLAVGTSVIRVLAADRDQPGTPNSRIRYMLADGSDGQGRFVIEPATGVLRTNKELDREVAEFYNLTAVATDMGSSPRSSSVLVYITVLDVNDNAPVFESAIIIRRIRENVPLGTPIDAAIKATDADQGANARVVYSLVGGDRYAFELSSTNGSFILLSRVELDYESPKKNYSLEVQAASQTLISKATVIVRLVDVNDNAPQLRNFFLIVNNYRQQFPTDVGRVPAFDPDECDKSNLRYSFKSGNEAGLLLLDATTGLVRLNPHLDSDRPTLATLVVTVGDGLYNATAKCMLQVRLITEEMLNNSVTLRLENMTPMTFMTDMYTYFVDALSTVLAVEQDRIYVIDIQNDTEVLDPNHPVLNVTFCALMSDDLDKADVLFSQTFLKETIYLKLNHLKNQSALTVLPFDDTLCLLEPCMNFADCTPILQFNETAPFMSSNAMLFRPIRTKKYLTCHCPAGFFGRKDDLSCDIEVNYCYSNPCKRGGTCVQKEGGYTCICPLWMSGTHCDVDVLPQVNATLLDGPLIGLGRCTTADNAGDRKLSQHCKARVVSFVPGSYLMFPKLHQRYRFKISLSFSTRSPDGLLFYNGRYNELHDFVALQLVSGNLHFSYSLGGDSPPTTAILIADGEHVFSDGNWHNVTVEYLNKTVIMSTGGHTCDVGVALLYSSSTQPLSTLRPCAVRSTLQLPNKCTNPTEQCYRFLDLTGPLMIGGLPTGVPTVPSLRSDSFSGCIANVFVDGTSLDLSKPVVPHNVRDGCPYKENFCASSPCVRGTCENGWMAFVCHCPPGYGGQTCQLAMDGPFGLFGTGSLRYRLAAQSTVGRSWFNGLSFATSKPNGTLLKVQLSTGESIVYRILTGFVVCTAGGKQYALGTSRLNDGQWHSLEVKFDSDKPEATRLYYSFDFGQIQSPMSLDGLRIFGAHVVEVLVGSDGTSPANGFFGCLKGAQVGNFREAFLVQPEMTGVEKSCIPPNPCSDKSCPEATSYCVRSRDGVAACSCRPGFAGPPACNSSVCSLSSPCRNGGRCSSVSVVAAAASAAAAGSGALAAAATAAAATARFGYKCRCAAGFGGDHCEHAVEQVCPASWWGRPLCGPCRCDTSLGFSSSCNITTGECYCMDGYYPTPKKDRCLPCDCHWPDGSTEASTCDAVSGQCRCRPGVQGRRCDECVDSSAELVAGGGCEVQDDACPRARADDVWWPRTGFGQAAITSCPAASRGAASRQCNADVSGWTAPNLDNCTSDDFAELLKQLVKLEGSGSAGERLRLAENTYAYTFAAKQLVANLSTASVSPRARLYANDLDIGRRAIKQVLDRETRMVGLNLTHTKDRAFLHNLFTAVSMVTDPGHANLWRKICAKDQTSVSELLLMMELYAQNLAFNLATLFAHGVMHEFDLASPNAIFGLDTVLLDNTSRVLIPKYNNYVQRPDMFDKHSSVSLPPSAFWLLQQHADSEKLAAGRTAWVHGKAVVAYVMYKGLGDLSLNCRQSFGSSISLASGLPLTINSPVITVAGQLGNQTLFALPSGGEVILTFKLLVNKGRTRPQCLSWLGDSWTSEQCTLVSFTEAANGNAFVKCACRHWGSYAVLMELSPAMEIAAVLLGLETYVAVPMAAVCLSLALAVFCCLNMVSGVKQGISCTVPIRCNMLLSMLVSLLVYTVGIDKTDYELACTAAAVALHFSVLASFFWLLTDLIHIYRTMEEAAERACNVNRGSMKFYYTLGYVVPSIIVALSFGLGRERYGTTRFCWLPLEDVIFWGLAGPVMCAAVVSLFMLVAGLRMSCVATSNQQRKRITTGHTHTSIRTSLWIAIIVLPVTVCLWVLGILAASERDAAYYHYAFAAFACIQGLYVLVAYVCCSQQAREELLRRLRLCCQCAQPSVQKQLLQHKIRHESLVNKQLLQLSALTCDSSLNGGLVDMNIPSSGPSTVTQSQTDSMLDHGLLAYLNTDGSTSASDYRQHRSYRQHRRRHRRRRYFSDDSDSDDSSCSDATSSFRSSSVVGDGGGVADETGGSGEHRRNSSGRRHRNKHGSDRHRHKRRTRGESSADGATHSTPSVQPHGVLPPPVHFMTPDAPSPDVVASTRAQPSDQGAPLHSTEADACTAEAGESDKLMEGRSAAAAAAADVGSPATATRRVKRSIRQPYLKSFDFI